MNYLITGCAGFIGYHISQSILRNNKNSKIFGIDNLNDYYSVVLKKKRLNILKKNKKFKFYKFNLTDKNKIISIFKKNKIDVVIHLAAQAGVRYSVIKPESYFESNILGFSNIIEISHFYNIKKFIFASSSSVYGDKKKYPISEKEKIYPKNIYSASKKLNEDMAKDISNISKMKIIGLRFFTIYGKWGRPDMFIFSFLKSIIKQNFFYLNNYGKHLRDFTHIEDAVIIINKLVKKKTSKKFQIFNICSNNPISINILIKKIYLYVGKQALLKKIKHNKLEVFKTHGDNKKIKRHLKLKKFRNIQYELKDIIDWYIKNKIWKIT
jgi:UDP-glucuronate 4-epimerase